MGQSQEFLLEESLKANLETQPWKKVAWHMEKLAQNSISLLPAGQSTDS